MGGRSAGSLLQGVGGLILALTFGVDPQQLRTRAEAEVQGWGWGTGCPRMGRSRRGRRQVPAKALQKCQRSNGRKQVQVSRPKGKWRAVRGRGLRWPWNGVGSDGARSQWQAEVPAVSTKAQGQDRYLVRGHGAFLMFLPTEPHKAAQAPGRGAPGHECVPDSALPIVPAPKFLSISCTLTRRQCE